MVSRTLADQADTPSTIFQQLSDGALGAVEARVLDEVSQCDLVADAEIEAVLVGRDIRCRRCPGLCRRQM
jgi:hypothetical protein